ncbi:hypothetical protein EfmGK941_23930 [Enterococcus faecium]|nr:hypothetical protein EfmGK941_23930 [Enterococcus faecium]
MIISTITEAIGSTPLYRFDNQHYSMPKGSAIYAKLEYLNPGGSIKDRLGSYLIKEGFAQGKINEKTDDHRTNCRKYRNWDRSGRTHIQIKNGFCCSREV